MNERDAWIALASAPGVGSLTFQRLLERFGSARDVLSAVVGLPPGGADRRLAGMMRTRLRAGLARTIRQAAEAPDRVPRAVAILGGWIVTPLDHDYPAALRAIGEPPAVLYGLGDPAAISAAPLVAVVGTRRPTAAGRHLATRITARLAEAGSTVVSGLAVGIDGVAHRAALEGRTRTVAVAGSGIDRPSPAPNRGLAPRIIAHGAIVSELAPGVSATPGTFPRRNRIISGLCRATIVVEAPRRSGALSTARHALEQGRLLLVAPGRPLDPRVAGSLELLRETPARPLVGLDEMVVDLGLTPEQGSGHGAEPSGQLSGAAALDLLEPTQRALARALAAGPATVDALCRTTGLDAGVVSAGLTMLQLRGWATAHGPIQLPAGPLARMDKPAAA